MKSWMIFPAILLGLAVCGCGTQTSPLPPHGNHALTEEEARDLVFDLPEVKAFCASVEQISGGSVHGFIMTDGEDSQGWQFYVGEDHDDHTCVWQRFCVDRQTGTIDVLDAILDTISLSRWREMKSHAPSELPE